MTAKYRVFASRRAPSAVKRESWAGLALVAEQVRDDLEAVCGEAEAELNIRSQGDNGIDARGAARWKIHRQQRHGCQRS